MNITPEEAQAALDDIRHVTRMARMDMHYEQLC